MGREAGLAQGQHLHPRSLQAPPFSRRQWEAVNEWAAARPSWAVPAAGWRRDRGGVRPPLGALDVARGGRCLSQHPKPHLGLPAGSRGGRGSLGSRGPGHAEQPLSRLEKPLSPALGGSHHSLCLGRFRLLVRIRPQNCCLHFGSTLQSHRSSRKATLAMPPPLEPFNGTLALHIMVLPALLASSASALDSLPAMCLSPASGPLHTLSPLR